MIVIIFFKNILGLDLEKQFEEHTKRSVIWIVNHFGVNKLQASLVDGFSLLSPIPGKHWRSSISFLRGIHAYKAYSELT